MIIECLINWLEDNNIFGKENLRDFRLQDDGNGIYIKEWNIFEIEMPKCLKIIEQKYSSIIKEEQKKQNEINRLLNELSKMDYKSLKYVDGEYSDEEWNNIVLKRKEIRSKVRVLKGV